MIKVENLSLKSPHKEILKNISLSVLRGEKLAILGESGSGKSMLLRTILGLLPQNICQIGQVYNGLRSGVILQNPSSCFDGIYTLRSHFVETLKAHKMDLEEEKWGLESVGLARDVLDSYPFELSGGMLQRAMIALALCINPDFVFSDEMTSDLDCIGVNEIVELLLSLQRQKGFGILFVTHDVFLAAKVADTIAILDNGRMIEYGKTQEILKTPKAIKTKELLDENQKLFQTPWGDFRARVN
ncbi:ABC transporter ATP-binding protein [Helicobacter mesocricetorum]|uniref:ABC transporter ATP-binding protein n=1 Tax=Helicobacter mesocricetorum TaxID=87012 RepID=UPI000CF10B53|nr:ATP-binding cassette domain-containing protein [Helicobacter mesocricetorum]